MTRKKGASPETDEPPKDAAANGAIANAANTNGEKNLPTFKVGPIATDRNNAVGYMLSFHALRYMPRAILCGDRNIEPVEIVGCAYVPFMCRNVGARSPGSRAMGNWPFRLEPC